ncbi:MAG: alpha-L-rhamnosidase, partial [Clostridia bacterium]|nr:alpha-L-rhamnosidase [Clostridia bacterium]
QEDCPSCLYAGKKGATTIWETWDGVRPDCTVHDTMNHYSYGGISGWLFDGVCGIQYRDGQLVIAPKPHPSLGHARAEWRAPVGTIKSSWQYEGNRLVFDISVPVQARIRLPDGREYTAEKGEHRYEARL